MGRILFFVLLGVALYVGFRMFRSARKRGDNAPAPKPGGSSEPMIRCAHCGLNLPRSEAIAVAGRHYCSESHQRLHEERR